MPARTMFRGDTLVVLFQVVRDVATSQLSTSPTPGIPPPGKVPFDLSGSTVWFTVKRHRLDPDAQAVFQGNSTALGGVVVTQPLSGSGQGTMPARATVGFPDGETDLQYDIEVVTPAGAVLTVEDGVVRVNPDVTRQTGATVAPPNPVAPTVSTNDGTKPLALAEVVAIQASVAAVPLQNASPVRQQGTAFSMLVTVSARPGPGEVVTLQARRGGVAVGAPVPVDETYAKGGYERGNLLGPVALAVGDEVQCDFGYAPGSAPTNPTVSVAISWG